MVVTFLAAAMLGLFEATLFFVVPDVYLTVVAQRSPLEALYGCAGSVAGALAGGVLMYWWGHAQPAAAVRALDLVPGIGPSMIGRVEEQLRSGSSKALFLGPLTGTPYKIYAALSGAMRLPLTRFVLTSIPARGLRFVALTGVAAWAARGPLASWSLPHRQMLTLALWSVFYVAYLRHHRSTRATGKRLTERERQRGLLA